MARKRGNAGKIIIAILVVAALYYVYGRFSAPPAQEQPMGGAPVSVAAVLERPIQQWNEYSGRLVATDWVEVRPQVSGVITKVHFKEGGLVKKGDLLFTIDPRPFEAEVTRAEGALASAEAQAKLAKNEIDRGKRLFDDKAISRHNFEERTSAYNVADANLRSAKAALRIAKLNLEYSHVKAPISGRISRAEITVGNLVESGPNAPVLATIVSSTPIYAEFEVDEAAFLRYVKAGADAAQEVPVRLGLTGEEGTPHEGRIQSFDNQLNNATGTIRVRAIFDNEDGLFVPGLYARIRLGTAEQRPAVLITDRAVGTDQNKKFVFVVGADNVVAYREVKLGGQAEGLRVVEEGLKPGERIIVNGLQRARPGVPVTPQEVPMDAPEAPSAGAPAAPAEAPAEAPAPQE